MKVTCNGGTGRTTITLSNLETRQFISGGITELRAVQKLVADARAATEKSSDQSEKKEEGTK